MKPGNPHRYALRESEHLKEREEQIARLTEIVSPRHIRILPPERKRHETRDGSPRYYCN